MPEFMPLHRLEEGESAFILPPRVYDLLRGSLVGVRLPTRRVIMVEGGGFLWGVDPLELGMGVFKHSRLIGRGVWYMAFALRERSRRLGDGLYEDLNPGLAAEMGIIHDGDKLRSGKAGKLGIQLGILGIEDLSLEERIFLGYPPDYREISPAADRAFRGRLGEKGFPVEVIEAVVGIDYPRTEAAIANPYRQMLVWANYSCGQEYTSIEERLDDLCQRWVLDYATNLSLFQHKSPAKIVRDYWQELELHPNARHRIDLQHAAAVAGIIQKAADTLFNYLGIGNQEFIEKYNLNNDASMPAWERVLHRVWQADFDRQKAGGRGAPAADRIEEMIVRRCF